jgi:hypothetical protein
MVKREAAIARVDNRTYGFCVEVFGGSQAEELPAWLPPSKVGAVWRFTMGRCQIERFGFSGLRR